MTLKSKDLRQSIFISHVQEDANFANYLKRKLKEAFLEAFDIFVSSDGSSIQGGDKWLATIEEAINRSSIVLVLATMKSIYSPWINFEAGAGWIKGARVIPLCLGGMNIGELPEPLKTFQAYNMCNTSHVHQLFKCVAGYMQMKLRTPKSGWKQISCEAEKVMSLSPEVRSAMDYALSTAIEWKDDFLSVPHLLVGLAHVEGGIVQDFLTGHNISLGTWTQVIYEKLDHPSPGLKGPSFTPAPTDGWNQVFDLANKYVLHEDRAQMDESTIIGAIFECRAGLLKKLGDELNVPLNELLKGQYKETPLNA